jgi:predicted RNase H-like HicB family nuclease
MQIKLQVSIIKQGKRYVAYSPALDISTTGKDLREAQKRFSEMIDIFFEELIENNTLDDVLLGLGWAKIKKQWEPPHVIQEKSVNIRIPVAA